MSKSYFAGYRKRNHSFQGNYAWKIPRLEEYKIKLSKDPQEVKNKHLEF